MPKATITAVVNQKGGTAKTTTAKFIAEKYAESDSLIIIIC